MKSILRYPEDNTDIVKLICNHGVVVFTNGCFDLLHTGHLKVLNAAKKEGDILIVGMNSDESVRRLKGPDRPIVNEEDRSNLLINLKAVDYVIIYDDPSVFKLIQFLSPDVLVKGGDYTLQKVVGHNIVMAYGGRVVIVPIADSNSTTNVIKKIKDFEFLP